MQIDMMHVGDAFPTEKQQSDEIKDLDKEQSELKIYKERAQELRRNKQGLEEQKSALQGEVKEMQAKVRSRASSVAIKIIRGLCRDHFRKLSGFPSGNMVPPSLIVSR